MDAAAEERRLEPIAMLTCLNPERADAAHQSLLHFVSPADWDDQAVRRYAAR